ncbi:MAG: zinc ribbon domain-containing protein [Deltaproteobacteria bacterium]|nr:zinc ribbon domain-containing protein [Deltaproteobacteria bacterium]
MQRLRETRRIPERIGGDPNPLAGILYCADYGHKMHYKQGVTDRENKPRNEYVCSSCRRHSRSCAMRYLRVDVVETLILRTVRAICDYALENEAKFMEKVREKSLIQAENSVRESRKKLTKS